MPLNVCLTITRDRNYFATAAFTELLRIYNYVIFQLVQ